MSLERYNQAISELKHSIIASVAICDGPTAQLALFLTKLIDFLEDTDIDRNTPEIEQLAYEIIVGVATYTHRHYVMLLKNPHKQTISQAVDNILIAVQQSRKTDYISGKELVLQSIAIASKELAPITKRNLKITNNKGVEL
jgi:hypothetical protein